MLFSLPSSSFVLLRLSLPNFRTRNHHLLLLLVTLHPVTMLRRYD
jgi:hypothetical protein